MSTPKMRTAEEWFSIQNGRTYAGDADYVAAIKEIQRNAIIATRAEYSGITKTAREWAEKLIARWQFLIDCHGSIEPGMCASVEILTKAIATTRAEYGGGTPEQCSAGRELAKIIKEEYPVMPCFPPAHWDRLARIALGMPDGEDAAE